MLRVMFLACFTMHLHSIAENVHCYSLEEMLASIGCKVTQRCACLRGARGAKRNCQLGEKVTFVVEG